MAIAGLRAGTGVAPLQAGVSAWEKWKTAFLQPDGRVLDALQGSASHSEGQAWGLLLAESQGDAAAFQQIETWTRDHLLIRRDALMAWRWIPGKGVPEWQNATEGDLFRAWSLLRAARRFDRPELLAIAAEIAGAILAICTAPDPRNARGRLLLPADRVTAAVHGGLLVNPSYIMPRALSELAEAFDLPELGQVSSDGVDLIRDLARSGPVPDWTVISTQGIEPALDRPHGSGYDALRVPLYLAWSGLLPLSVPPRRGAAVVTRRDSDGTIREESNLSGYRALDAFLHCAATGEARMWPAFDPNQPYYPATLAMLSALAAIESPWACAP